MQSHLSVPSVTDLLTFLQALKRTKLHFEKRSAVVTLEDYLLAPSKEQTVHSQLPSLVCLNFYY